MKRAKKTSQVEMFHTPHPLAPSPTPRHEVTLRGEGEKSLEGLSGSPSPRSAKGAKLERGLGGEVRDKVDLTPEAERLLSNFEVLAEAPGGVKRLRELVLGLAIAGKLTRSMPDDGDASTLIAQISRAKSGIGAAINITDTPYSVPANWKWLRMADLGTFVGGGTPSKSNLEFWSGTIPWVSPKDMKKPRIDDAEDHISEAAVEGSSVKLIGAGAILFVVRGMILAHSFPTAITGTTVTINQDMKALILTMPSLGEYLMHACQANRQRILQRVEHSSHGTCRLDSDQLAQFPIALPPLAEQKRIVAKVDELMKLCDELEARQAKARETGARLTKAALDALANAEGPEEVATSWKRVVGNFEGLISRADDVKKVRELVLSLAVRGRLVGQDERDEPASIAFERLSKAARTSTLMHASDPKNSPAESPLEPLFELPSGWDWKPFRQLLLGASMGIDRGRSMQGYERAYGYFKMNNIKNFGGFDITDLTRIDATADETKKFALVDGDFLFNTRNSRELVGKTCVFRSQSADTILYNNNILRARIFSEFSAEFVDMWFRSPQGSLELEKLKSNTTNVCAIYLGNLWEFPCPLPPLAEQKRIVAKVDQLMALCDALETKLRQTEETSRKVAEALVGELVQPKLAD